MNFSSDEQRELFHNNPFLSGAASEPWENQAPDVESLNQGAYDHICGLIRTTGENPSSALAGIVLGEAGMGKTHLLKRLLRYTQRTDVNVLFVSVKPFSSSKRPKCYLLREIVVNLSREKQKDLSQFDYLVKKIVERYFMEEKVIAREKQKASSRFDCFLRKIMARCFGETKPCFETQQWRTHFQGAFPGIYENLLSAIFQYHSADASKRSLILNWLDGSVHEDHASVLHFLDREGMEDFEREAEAGGILTSLGMLLRYCGMSMVVCFDQLDGMKDSSLIGAFEDAVAVLVNDIDSILPLAFARPNTWKARLSSSLDPAAIRRLESNQIPLLGCTLAQARELIGSRVASKFGDDSDKKFQWLLVQLEGKLKGGGSPSDAITLANRAIMQSLELGEKGREKTDSDVIKEVFTDKYNQERKDVANHLEMWPPDAERMAKTLRVYLETRPGYDALQRPNKSSAYILLYGKYRGPDGKKVECAFILNTAENHMSVKAAFKCGVEFLDTHPNGRCYYISDVRCAFRDKTRWKQVHEVKDDFDARRGNTIFLTPSQAALWYGLTSLIFNLEEGDISLPLVAGPRPAGEKDFELYMREAFGENLLASEETPPAFPPVPLPESGILEKQIITFLKNAPMLMSTVTILSDNLQRKGVKINPNELLEFFGERKDKFALHAASDGKIVRLI
ncbi:MAG: ATP-binding protein [Synergistaceae bacterium]|jgi:hypothetical protein|nr:ATP-binding protein [Synergistaceae bacterium]